MYMGLFDKLVEKGLKAVKEAVTDVVSDVVTDTLGTGWGQSDKEQPVRKPAPAVSRPMDNRSFDMKFTQIVNGMEGYEVRKGFSPDALEAEAGRQLYTRGGCFAKPAELTYVVLKDGERKGFVNLWTTYENYKHTANRELKDYCDNNGIKMVDFFEYLPNEYGYMEERIRREFA